MVFHEAVPQFIEDGGFLAPILFIIIHLIRPFLFIPVLFVCIAGGYLFGFVQGTIYSIIGLSLVSFYFYHILETFPSFRQRIMKLKRKILKDRVLTIGQIMVLRLIPFIHFHLLSLYLIEMTRSFREYMKYSIGGVIIPSIIYTGFGQAIADMPLSLSVPIIVFLISLFTYFGKRGTVIYKWNHFFPSKTTSE